MVVYPAVTTFEERSWRCAPGCHNLGRRILAGTVIEMHLEYGVMGLFCVPRDMTHWLDAWDGISAHRSCLGLTVIQEWLNLVKRDQSGDRPVCLPSHPPCIYDILGFCDSG